MKLTVCFFYSLIFLFYLQVDAKLNSRFLNFVHFVYVCFEVKHYIRQILQKKFIEKILRNILI